MSPHCQTCRQHNTAQQQQSSYRKYRHHHSKIKRNPLSSSGSIKTPHVGCGICKQDHRLATCEKFLNLNLIEKYETVNRLHYCFNCLARSHILGECKSRARCFKCKGNHHTSLHGHPRLLEHLPHKKQSSFEPATSTSYRTVSCNVLRTVVPTALVKIQCHSNGKLTRAIISSSSISTMISAEFVKENGLVTYVVDSTAYTRLLFKSTVPSYDSFEVHAMVSKDLPKRPYKCPFSETLLEKFSRIELADPRFTANDQIYLEIGADLYPSIVKSNIMKSEGGLLIAQDSSLGWLIIGSATS